MAAIISYTRIYRWMIKRQNNGEEHGAEIAFCKDYLLKNIPIIDKLYY